MMMTLEKQSDAFIFDFQATYQKKYIYIYIYMIFKLTSENQIDFHETVARCSLSYHLVCRVATWGG